jgi:hypothetical protein
MDVRFTTEEFEGSVFCFQSVSIGPETLWLWLGRDIRSGEASRLALSSTALQLFSGDRRNANTIIEPTLLLPQLDYSLCSDASRRLAKRLGALLQRNIYLSVSVGADWLANLFEESDVPNNSQNGHVLNHTTSGGRERALPGSRFEIFVIESFSKLLS